MYKPNVRALWSAQVCKNNRTMVPIFQSILIPINSCIWFQLSTFYNNILILEKAKSPYLFSCKHFKVNQPRFKRHERYNLKLEILLTFLAILYVKENQFTNGMKGVVVVEWFAGLTKDEDLASSPGRVRMLVIKSLIFICQSEKLGLNWDLEIDCHSILPITHRVIYMAEMFSIKLVEIVHTLCEWIRWPELWYLYSAYIFFFIKRYVI